MLRIAICDDDHYICRELEQRILEFEASSPVKIEMELFYRGEDLLKFIQREHGFDLIFLDIELGTTTGVDVGHKIRDEWNDYISKIVFISGANGYDRQLFAVQPFDFLEKPIDVQRLYHCIRVTTQILGLEHRAFTYKADREQKRVWVKDIVYFESNLRKIKMVTTSGDAHFNSTLSEIQGQLPPTFLSPHGSFLVNFSHVTSIGKDKMIMSNGTSIFISRRNMGAVRDMQIQFAKEMQFNV